MIEVRALTVRFPGREKPAVSDVSFRVAAGEAFGLVGESGCGKTTVLRALAGLLAGWTGEIELAGRRRSPNKFKALPNIVQMVFQESLWVPAPESHDRARALRTDRYSQTRSCRTAHGRSVGKRRAAGAVPASASPSAFRWGTSARGHRPGADLEPEDFAAGRTDFGPRRLGSSGSGEPIAAAAWGIGPYLSPGEP